MTSPKECKASRDDAGKATRLDNQVMTILKECLSR